MMDSDLKKKIVNTIQFYELKCDKLEGKITALKQVIEQLLDHLFIPAELIERKEQMKGLLKNDFNEDNFNPFVHGLTDLVEDSFNREQNRIKDFLAQLTGKLEDFDSYLKVSSDERQDASQESLQLEDNIQNDIRQIKTHLGNSVTIEELSGKISANLGMIGERLNEYRSKEEARNQENTKHVDALQQQLAESERSVQEIQAILFSQKDKINHDSLTHLPNREAYNNHIADALKQWNKKSTIFSIAIGDLDHFKYINDTFGHLAGDKVLKKVADLFRESTRPEDFIARIGGEEFIVIFDHTPGQKAGVILERLRKSIEECQFVYNESEVKVTISFGVATITQNDDLESLFSRADAAMYQAKKAGRNRIKIC